MRRLLITLVLFLTCLTTCCRTVAPDEPLEKYRNISVKIEVSIGPSIYQLGSGTIISKDENNTAIVLTNYHVVAIKLKNTDNLDIVYIPSSVTVITTDGKSYSGEIIKTETRFISKRDVVDLAFIKVLRMDGSGQSIDGISRDGLQIDEDVLAIPFTPYNEPLVIRAKGVESRYFDDAFKGDIEVIGGNSGSPVYEKKTGLLVGIIWGKFRSEGFIVNSMKITDVLRANNYFK